jgi:hypothetical protein
MRLGLPTVTSVVVFLRNIPFSVTNLFKKDDPVVSRSSSMCCVVRQDDYCFGGPDDRWARFLCGQKCISCEKDPLVCCCGAPSFMTLKDVYSNESAFDQKQRP